MAKKCNSPGSQFLSEKYEKLEPYGSDMHVVRFRRRYNLVRSDGTMVLGKWVSGIGDLHKGFFIISGTKRGTQTEPTRRCYGLAHTDGTVVFPPIFDKITWREQSFFVAEKGSRTYIIKEDGSIIDLSLEHLPKRLEIDQKVFVEKALNWILTGMRVYYRDSEANINAAKVYDVGRIIRAGFFVDVSSRLTRPMTKLRFLICSAHAAPWDAINELVADNPGIAHWGFSTLHCNSYYIVLDVYTKGSVTQVSLLHIPPAVAKNIGESAPALIKIINELKTDKGTIVEITRHLLDRNLRSRRSSMGDDDYMLQCMRHPVGLNNVFDHVPLEPARLKGDAAALGRIVSRLAKDDDIDNFYTGREV
jgi:hypothetical protein